MYEVFQNYLDSKINLSQEDASRIRALGVIKKLRKRQYLLQEGDIWKFHAFVLKGCMRTYAVDEKGQEHVTGFAIENWWTGDKESLLLQQPSRFNIDAIEDSEVLLFNHLDFDQICREIPVFNDMINAIVLKGFTALQNRVHATITLTAEEKYLDFVRKYPGFALRIPQSMIASYLGITPETLSRVRKQSAKK